MGRKLSHGNYNWGQIITEVCSVIQRFPAFLEEKLSHVAQRLFAICAARSWRPPSGHTYVLSSFITKSLFRCLKPLWVYQLHCTQHKCLGVLLVFQIRN